MNAGLSPSTQYAVVVDCTANGAYWLAADTTPVQFSGVMTPNNLLGNTGSGYSVTSTLAVAGQIIELSST